MDSRMTTKSVINFLTNFSETQRDIHQRITDELSDCGLDNIHLSFYLTSIYDHSIFEVFSKVVQKLITQQPTLENLLNILCANSGIEKAFLFDIVSKIYIATDSSPVDMQSYELCSDMIDVIIDISLIYGISPMNSNNNSNNNNNNNSTSPAALGIPETPESPYRSHSALSIPYDENSAASITLNNGMILYLREVTK